MAPLQPILMPKLGLTMTEGTLAEWKVAPGDVVATGDLIFVVETDKISNEIAAPCDGVVAALHAAAGDVLPVGAILASLHVADQVVRPGASSPDEPHRSAPDAGPDRGESWPCPAGARVRATPLARRMASSAGIDLAQVSGSGPRGRIVAADLAAVLATTGQADPVAGAAAAAPSSAGTLRELSAHQRVAVRRLTEAKREIPHFYVFAEADVTALLSLREQLNAEQGRVKLTLNHFLIAAVARALATAPQMNCVWAEAGVRELAAIEIGVAVEGPKGLVAPVLRDLADLALDEIAAAATALVERARAGRLVQEDFAGGAVTISNVGMFGATALVPIINPGQSSIVGVGANVPVFRPDDDGRPVLRQILNLALSCDHRVIDGALAARFLHSVRRRLETAAGLLRRPQREPTP